jgi:hypothetical protein
MNYKSRAKRAEWRISGQNHAERGRIARSGALQDGAFHQKLGCGRARGEAGVGGIAETTF